MRIILSLVPALVLGQDVRAPVTVTFAGPKTELTDVFIPIDPVQRITWGYPGQMGFGLTAPPNNLLCCGDGAIRTYLRVDGQAQFPFNASAPFNLPPGPGGKVRKGVYSTWTHPANVHFTHTVELIPSQARPGEKRKLDAVLVTYEAENKDTKAHEVGFRVRMDAYCGNNDGPLIAAPTKFPKQILNGVDLKDKTLPEYVVVLQQPDLANPGFSAHLTLKMSQGIEGAGRLIHTSHGAGDNGWDVPVIPSNGDSDIVIYWEPKPLAPGAKRRVGYAYGVGLAGNLSNEGTIHLDFAGNFEPGKTVTLLARVDDPIPGQTLILDLGEGVTRLEGKEIEPVPPVLPDTGFGLVMWKLRLDRLGQFTVTVRSSHGATVTRQFTTAKTN